MTSQAYQWKDGTWHTVPEPFGNTRDQQIANIGKSTLTSAPGSTSKPTPAPASGGGATPSSPTQSNQPPKTNVQKILEKLPNSKFSGSKTLEDIIKNYTTSRISSSGFGGQTDVWMDNVAQTINQYENTFSTMFKNYVGRDPTSDEYDQFLKSVVMGDRPWDVAADFTSKVGQETKGFLTDVYSGAAQDEASKKIQSLTDQALAPGSAFDTWSNSYRNAISGVEQSLTDYQTRLMDKIRPQLLTSLQSQGLLNTGALNEAFAGQASDLANTASNYVAGLRGQAEQDIANQKYQIQSNPTGYKLNNAYGSVPNMTAVGQNSLQNVWQSYLNDQAFQQQMQLMNAQRSNQQSLLQQYGGMILGGSLAGFAQGYGQNLGAGNRNQGNTIVG